MRFNLALSMYRRMRRRVRARRRERQVRRDIIPIVEPAPKTREELRVLLEAYPDGFICYPENPSVFGFDDPEEMDRRVKEAEAGNFIPADQFFNGIRAKIHARR